ncbi:MAG: DUF354 domain-containing protein [archaeon YNP-WB-062]|nr:DUF354 domain-containing protein [Candidatus Culexarchaeum yellowstonense]
MKAIWIDALTPKQALLSIKIMEAAWKIGYKSIITTREYDYTTKIYKLYDLNPIIVGRHGGEKLEGKLMASLDRSIKLAETIIGLEHKPSYHISLTSPEAVRVAFGLSIPIILLSDTPHSKYVNKLTIPLADILITPKAIPKEEYRNLIDEERIIQYDGVDELAWIKDFKPDERVLNEIGLNTNDKIIIAREAEYKASYYEQNGKLVKMLIEKIIREFGEEVKVIYLPRYNDESIPNGAIVPKDAVDARSIMKYATLTITGGGTMARESALIGTPSISLFPKQIHVNKWLEERGLPIKSIRDINEAYEYASKVIRDPDRYKVKTDEIIRGMEDPTQVIMRILRGDIDG